MKTSIFVYGTLRTGCRNWHRYLSSLVGTPATTMDCFTMRVVREGEEASYPILEPVQGMPVVGEIFSIDDQQLADIDALEQHPHWYRRSQVKVRCGESEIREVWMYLMPAGQYEDAVILESGDWTDIESPRPPSSEEASAS